MRRIAMCLLLAGLAAAGPRDNEALLKEAISQLETAFKSGDWMLVRSALWRARAIRDRYNAKDALPLAKAVAAGSFSGNERIDLAALDTLAKLRVPGSTLLIKRHLQPAMDIPHAAIKVPVGAIRAAGALHERAGLPLLEKLLLHSDRALAVEAATALGRYWVMEDKPLVSLVSRLARQLEKLRLQLKRAVKAKHEARTQHYQALTDALLAALRTLTGDDKVTSHADFKAWCKKKLKSMRS